MQAFIGLLTSVGSALTGGTATAAATTATSGISLSTILQGGFTALSAASSIMAGAAEADRLQAEAVDAEAAVPLVNLQGINRRASIKAAMADAIASQNTAYAASGVDLSFGTPARARADAYREADLGLTTDAATQDLRTMRLNQRATSYRRAAARAGISGLLDGLGTAYKGFSSIAGRGAPRPDAWRGLRS